MNIIILVSKNRFISREYAIVLIIRMILTFNKNRHRQFNTRLQQIKSHGLNFITVMCSVFITR